MPTTTLDQRSIRQRLPSTAILADVLKANPRLLQKFERAFAMGNPGSVARVAGELGLPMVNCGQGDFVLTWLMNLRTRHSILVAVMCLLAGLATATAGWLEGVFRNPTIPTDMIHDYGLWNFLFICFPTIVLMASLYFSSFPRTIFGLCVRGVLHARICEIRRRTDYANSLFGNRFLVWTPLLASVAVGIMLSYVYVLGGTLSWHRPTSHPHGTFAAWWVCLVSIAIYYLIFAVMIRTAIVYLVLRRFFRCRAVIQPLHPDGCGGLWPLGRLSHRLNVPVFLFGLVATVGIFVNVRVWHQALFGYVNVLMMLLYLAGSILVFFLPLYAAHDAMRRAKEREMGIISTRFQATHEHITALLAQGATVNRKLLSEIESLRKLHSIARHMPVYPLNIKIGSSFLASMAVPILTLFAEHFLRN